MLARIVLAAVAFPVLGALSALSSRYSRVVSLGLAVLSLALPFVVPPEHTLLRVFLALGSALFVFRAVDLARDSRSWPWLDRVWLMFAIFDVRERTEIPRSLHWRAALTFIGYVALVLVGLMLVLRVAPGLGGGAGLAVRWLGGAFVIYGAADASSSLNELLLALGGMRAPEQQRTPVLARSVREFWSERWNRNVHAWFRRHTFLPLARRGHRRLGILLAFVASAVLHFWLVAAPIGVVWAIPMAAFFLVQGVAALLETKLSVRNWSRGTQHVWTVSAILGTSPLFVEPMLRVFAI